MQRSFQRFRHNERGNVAVLVALSLMMLVTLVFGMLHFAKTYSVRSSVQAALDAAAIAAASESFLRTDSPAAISTKLQAVAQKVLTANLSIDPAVATVTPVKLIYTPAAGLTTSESMSLSVGATVESGFLGALGLKDTVVTIKSGVEPAQDAPVEIALALDVTTSMSEVPTGGGSTKIAALKTAAKALVNQVMAVTNPNVKIGIVPFTTFVNIGEQKPTPPWVIPIDRINFDVDVCTTTTVADCEKVKTYECTWVSDGVTKTTTCTEWKCTNGKQDCKKQDVAVYGLTGCLGPRGVKSNTPSAVLNNPTSEAYLDNINDPLTYKYPGYSNAITPRPCPNPQIVLPLTNDRAKVLSAIDKLTTGGDTFIPSGLIWGWNMLTPDAPLTEAAPAADFKKIGGRKVLILMTDGANSASPRLPDGNVFVNNNSNLNAVPAWKDGTESVKLISKICDNIKAEGVIEVYTVLFDVQGSDKMTADTRTYLSNCFDAVKKRGGTFSANNSAGLLDAFTNIGNELRVLKITN